MIIEYHRPETLESALALLARSTPETVPLGGGSAINRPSPAELAVVDLQALGLDSLQARGNSLELGARLTLQALLDEEQAFLGLGARLQPALQNAIRHEAAYNLRQVATLAGTLVSSDGRSPLATVFLALDAALTLLPGSEQLQLGEVLPLRRERLSRKLITQINIPLNARLSYHYVARTPADRPQVCAAAAVWPSGRTRVALGGFGKSPLLILDGTETAGAPEAARSAYSGAADDWASADYRQEAAAILAQRCVEEAAAA